MRRMTKVQLVAVFLLGATTLHAQATRTWVSGVGDDANPCSRTAPCKTWAGAISKTASGGEIDALDPGGFGGVTITKAITLDGGGGQVASILVSGSNGIVVSAGPNDIVTIRNLRINGLLGGNNTAGVNGIRFLSGKGLEVENCFIFGFAQSGIDIALNQASFVAVHILNTVLKNNGQVGIRATNAQAAGVIVGIDKTVVILTSNSGAIGIEAAQHSRVIVSNSICQNNNGDGMKVDDAVTSDAQLTVYESDASFNVNGFTNGTGGSLNIAFSNASNNLSCQFNNAGAAGNFVSHGNNRATGSNCGTITAIPQI
jgi:hypothetical protein